METFSLTSSPDLLYAIIVVGLLIMAVVIFLGKGDHFIAGYNLASPEKKAQYNMSRLRGLTAAIAALGAVLLLLLWLVPGHSTLWTVVFLVLVVIELFLINTWAKKKD